ncbi:MAG TPA: hypothetical protein VG738_14415 [Chitinophagaceae bacterium]|nr:hypothetical protein [Chitinophagaceae bacterium]
MIWLIIPACILLILIWLLLLPVECFVDTRVPVMTVTWAIATIMITYDGNEWMLTYKALFFQNTIPLKRRGRRVQKNKKKAIEKPGAKMFAKMINVLKCMRVKQWQLGLDTGDYVLNSWIYPLNFLKALQHHVFVNFNEETYVVLCAKAVPLRAIYAYMK